MGKWTLGSYDDILRDKMKSLVMSAVKRSNLEENEPSISYEAFIEELDNHSRRKPVRGTYTGNKWEDLEDQYVHIHAAASAQLRFLTRMKLWSRRRRRQDIDSTLSCMTPTIPHHLNWNMKEIQRCGNPILR
ncbi:hypothetical protein NM688_g4450 [Phlebia brevispora]|uniref:Uncharacterized protein n=1 Tax=Phlebia brevispora TaxID=194682 RepID=A0ACC1T326_9APHY|nr:hypothetical protein NM688_g4450 [Phlebia brevispora]